MKLGVAKNKKKILVSGCNNSMVIHPMWLRERVTDAKYLDKNNGQRLYDPSKNEVGPLCALTKSGGFLNFLTSGLYKKE